VARIRSVHPDICQSEAMAAISASGERTFVRLWTHCDDDGRCVDNPRLIKAALYPLHEDVTATTLETDLLELTDAGLIVRYAVDGKRYLVIRSWAEYQHPQRPRASKYPPPQCILPDTSASPRVHVADVQGTGVEGRQERERESGGDRGGATVEADLARYLAQCVHRNGARTPDDLSAWESIVAEMLYSDRRDPDEIRDVIRWCSTESFWKPIILNAAKLREHYDAVNIRRKGETDVALDAASAAFLARHA